MVAVRLVPVDAQLSESIRMGDAELRQRYGARVAGDAPALRDVVEQTEAMLARAPREPRWGGYLAIEETNAVVVGTCAFKDAPSEDGTVEIAYFTFPSHEGRGYGTAMARGLVSIASSSGLVRRVIAHTQPEENASTAILKKVGMRFDGEVQDPEDGRVWRWLIQTGA